MLYPRMVEEKMLNLLRQGKVSKWFSGIGQEAISVGVTMAVPPETYLFPLHRNLGVFTTRKVPLDRLICQWQGKENGFTKGRDRSFHFGAIEHRIVGMISHLGPQLALADGVALAHKIMAEPKVAVAFTGEGATSEGDFHEALNVAAVWQLPVIFIIENNGYALSTPTKEQYRCQDLADRAKGYGMTAHVVDGNNVVEVYQKVHEVVDEIMARPAPVLIECKTFRMRGHEEASGTKYVPDELLSYWRARDPISNYTEYLVAQGLITEVEIEAYRQETKKEINALVKDAFSMPEISSTDREIEDVYRKATKVNHHEDLRGQGTDTRYVDAIAQALDQAMTIDKRLVLMGQDIADYGGVFKVTDGLLEKYGADRVRNTPLCESAIIGTAIGLTFKGFSAMVEMQFADFVSCGFNQIVNNLAKLHYRWSHAANVTIRMPTGGNVGAGPFHSQSNEAWFFHVPGLKIVYPSDAFDAKGLLMASLADPNPVMFFEHKYLYRTQSAAVPRQPYTLPMGKARLIREGRNATCITYGLGVSWAIQAQAELDIDLEIVDLRCLQPLDWKSIEHSVLKTGRVIILHEANLTGGVGAELSAYISEHLFEHLDAPVLRVASLDTPVPFARALEQEYLPAERFLKQLEFLLAY